MHFVDKINRTGVSNAAPQLSPVIVDRPVAEPLSCQMLLHRPTTVAEVEAILKKPAAKQCQLDPVPTWLVKRASNISASLISGMRNHASLELSRLHANAL